MCVFYLCDPLDFPFKPAMNFFQGLLAVCVKNPELGLVMFIVFVFDNVGNRKDLVPWIMGFTVTESESKIELISMQGGTLSSSRLPRLRFQNIQQRQPIQGTLLLSPPVESGRY